MGKITACLSHGGGGAGNAAMRAGLAFEPRNEIILIVIRELFTRMFQSEESCMLNLKVCSMRKDSVVQKCAIMQIVKPDSRESCLAET